jgi:hypothetical protein
MNYQLGERSKKVYDTLHHDLQLIIDEALKDSDVDFCLVEGERTIETQQKYFNEGKSKVNPSAYDNILDLLHVGKHLTHQVYRTKSWAFDFCAYVKGYKDSAYDVYHLMYLVGVFITTANRLRREGKIKSVVRSGANWDKDGVLKHDQSFFDSPHIEIYKIID